MNKTLVFDMDGTIADLYGVNGWLEDLRAERTRPYDNAELMYREDILNSLLQVFKRAGWRIVVTTWLAKNSSKEYDTLVREAKLAWLEKYNFPYDEIHLVKYGTSKVECTKDLGGFQVLVDDNEEVRKGWTLGDTVDANKNVLAELVKIIGKYL